MKGAARFDFETMAHKRKGQFAVSVEWARHLRPYARRAFWKKERAAVKSLMRAEVRVLDPAAEFYTPEGCYINELSNTDADPGASIAHARVRPGVTTRWHLLRGIGERYVVLSGTGTVEIGEHPPKKVAAGDAVLIPPGCRQRITSDGNEDLVFLAICTPRFRPEAYEDVDPAPMRDGA
jgi:mannose-6-phosphate isomerase-like protein (cupin superfamily)